MSHLTLRQRARTATLIARNEARANQTRADALKRLEGSRNRREHVPLLRGSEPALLLVAGVVLILAAVLLLIAAGWQPGTRQVEVWTERGAITDSR